MGRISGQEHPAPLKRLGDPRVVEVDPAAHDGRQFRLSVSGREQRFHVFGRNDRLLVIFGLKQKFETSMPIWQWNDQHRLG